MNCLRSYFACLPAVACLLFATGCTSIRYSTTLPASGRRDRCLGLVKVNITNVVVSSPAGRGNIVPELSRKSFMTAARGQYPLIFDEDRNALPVNVEVACDYDDGRERDGKYALYTLLAVGLVPVPAPGANEAGDFSVRVSADDPGQGVIEYPVVTFQRQNAAWWTVFSPLGLIPVPGQSDVPRSSSTMFNDDDREWTRKGWSLSEASCVEAVVRALEAGDLSRMDTAGQNAGFRRDVADVLRGETAELRIAAVKDLADRGDLRAKDVLRLAVYDPDPAVRAAAADALMQLGQPPTAEELRRLGKLYPALDQYEADFKLMMKSDVCRLGGQLDEQRRKNLLGRMITLVPELVPAPPIPDEARSLFGKGSAFRAKARTSADFELAVRAYDQALRICPWWAEAYYHRALAEGDAGRFADAARDFQLYLLSKPPTQAADEARERLLQMQAKHAESGRKTPPENF